MTEEISAADIRMVAVNVLRKRGYVVESIAKGVGSPPFSLVKATRGGDELVCSIKAVTRPHGRVHYARSQSGGWVSLSKATHVLHAWHNQNAPDHVSVSLFPAEVIRAAFDKNLALRKSPETQTLPIWLGPKLEGGDRFAGSGYAEAAIWQEVVPVAPVSTRQPISPVPSTPPTGVSGSVLETAKAMLAAHLGVSVDRIELEVRIRA